MFCRRKVKTGVPVGKGLLLKRGIRGGGWRKGQILKKTDEKNNEFVTCRGVFESKKNKINIRGFLNTFFKNAHFSPICKADYLLTIDFKGCFFSMVANAILGQSSFPK